MENKKLTYADVGINITDTDALKLEMAASMQTTERRVLSSHGAFASLYDIRFPEYEHPVLVMKTEEPGSKQKLAVQYNRIRSICYDMINHLINDIIVMGAKPLAVQDAIITGSVNTEVISQIVKGVADACKEQDCTLTGGETSIQPGVLEEGVFILTSSIIGIVDKKDIIDGSTIREGDIVLALPSNGLHTNGYTLVRAILDKNPEIYNTTVDGESFLDAIMNPHYCYYHALKGLFHCSGLHGMAHITGGGIEGNLNRILPNHLDAEVNLSLVRVLTLFNKLRIAGNVDEADMLKTFNMGVGMVLVIDPNDLNHIQAHLQENHINGYVIGEIIHGKGNVTYVNQVVWQ